MGTRWVQRDDAGNITGDFANRQEGYAEEEIDDAHPELVQRNADLEAARAEVVKPAIDKVLDLLVAKNVIAKVDADAVKASP